MTNPDNFTDHRKAMIRFSRIMGTLASGYIISKNEQYASRAFQHARAWFIDTATLMNPHLLYAQAIKGRFTGRGIGIIDMIQMMEVSQALIVLEKVNLPSLLNMFSFVYGLKNTSTGSRTINMVLMR